jgi:hypothetical protein
MKLTKEQIEQYLDSPAAQDVIIVAAYCLDQTKTDVDNQVVAQISDYADLFAEKLAKIEELNPDGKEAVNAALRLAQLIAAKTDTKWDDIIIGLASKITGANKN